MPGGGCENKALAFLLDGDGGRARIDLVARNHRLVFAARIFIRLEDVLDRPASHAHGGVFARRQGFLALQVVNEGIDDFGGGARGLPVVQFLVEEEPLDHAVLARILRRKLHQRLEREGMGFDRVVVPEPRPVLRGPESALILGSLCRIHDAREDQFGIRGAGHSLQRERQHAFQVG